ncbi:PQQ-dependent sugar dehydrogenase [Candidatus Kaiserbacteria bacterium]|nr:PQQ-dependent sugar dehydrogenase [Candidatus Kaiserbacteria bacterium]
MKKKLIALAALVLAVVAVWFALRIYQEASGALPIISPAPELPAGDEDLPFTVPQGFSVSVFSRETPGARALTRDPKGTLLASLMSKGKIVALPDIDSNGKADEVITILEGLRNPHGILIHCPDPIREPPASNGAGTGSESARQDACRLYVAEEDVVRSYAYDADTFTVSSPRTIVSLPQSGGHSTRTLLLHPDGKTLLVSVGSSCNVCEEKDARRAKVLAIDIEEGAFGTPTDFSTGLRNMVFMAIHPVTGEIWGTEMGRDLLGDDTPPDEVNILERGKNYGWPICYGKNVHDSAYDKNTYFRNPCMEPFEIPSHIDIPAHSAPLGLAFVPEEGWPEDYWHDLFVAYHGSWNRSTPTGYKIVRFDLDPHGKPTGEVSDFMAGFILPAQAGDGRTVIGRPVDILIQPGGTMYVSDDRAGAIYRIYRTR